MQTNVLIVFIISILVQLKFHEMHLIYRRAVSKSESENLSKDSELSNNYSDNEANHGVEDNINNNEMTSNDELFLNHLYENYNDGMFTNNPYVSSTLNNKKDWRKKRKWRRDIFPIVPSLSIHSVDPKKEDITKLAELLSLRNNLTQKYDSSSNVSPKKREGQLIRSILKSGANFKTAREKQESPEENILRDKIYENYDSGSNLNNGLHYYIIGELEKDSATMANETSNIKKRVNSPKFSISQLSNSALGKSEIPLLQQIAEDLEDLRKDKVQCKGNEGMPCSIVGSWVSQLGGVRFDIVANKSGKIHASLCETIPKTKGMFSAKWVVEGIAPFIHGGPFSLTAIESETKQIAVFVGQCRVCNKIESITGWWTFGRPTRDCQDVSQAEEMHPDLFQREYLHTLREIKLREINNGKTESTTIQSTTVESFTNASSSNVTISKRHETVKGH